jgi:Arc/MetJ-type ribon-helix-helix transcriptional regulator
LNTRLGVRVSQELREKMQQLIEDEEYKDFSELIRNAVERLLESKHKVKNSNNLNKEVRA